MPRNKQVDDWFERYDNPMKDVVLRMREIIILGADPALPEPFAAARRASTA